MKLYLTLTLYILLCVGCRENYAPKPYSYFRIDFPEKSYSHLSGEYPYTFDIAGNSVVETDKYAPNEPYWININYPAYNAKIHISYKPIDTDTALTYFRQDCHRLAYTHTIKAESIKEELFEKENGTIGLIYFIEGNTASSTQFFATDSTRHFLRGALYFNERPNKDSLAPIINYIRKDIIHLIETIEWKTK